MTTTEQTAAGGGPLARLVGRMAAAAKPRRIRSMRRFAEEEIVIPDGPFKGQRFRADRQPFSELWFDEVDRGGWRRHASTGPTQTGKTLLCTIIPALYHLFEVGETVIYGVPTMEVAVDKWQADLRPAILASRYADQIPASGLGSKNGKIVRIQFKNGATLRFMSGGGGDENRSAFTARVVVITEADKMDEQGGTSREADKITQLERRTDAYGERSRIYLECTVSIEEGRIWQEITNGTNSRIGLPCPHCRRLVTPEREQLVGWRDAADVLAAGDAAALCCPDCGATWTESQRVEANRHGARLIHRGQEARADGSVAGTPARTDTLGFRWTCVNNLLAPIAVVGRDEWKALRAADEDNAEQALVQFKWARPFKPKGLEADELDYQAILRRTVNEPKGRVPSDAEFVVTTIDVGKQLCRWGTLAMRSDRTPHLVEYGVIEVPSANMEERRALMLALREFRDQTLARGWESDNGPAHPELVLVDEGYLAPVVRAFCQESGGLAAGYAPAKGFGITQYLKQQYHAPRKVGESVAYLGDQYHLARVSGGQAGGGRLRLFDINADHWKGKLHAALRVPMGGAGGLTLHQASTDEQGRPRVNDHLTIAKHFTAERPVEEFSPGVGRVIRWRVVHRNNHFLDMGSMALVALDYVAAQRDRAAAAAGDRPSPRATRLRAPPTDDAAGAAAPSADLAAGDEGGSEPPPPAAAAKQGGGWFGSRRKR